jgi:hypothetical protein
MNRGLCYTAVVLLAVLAVPFIAAAATPRASAVSPGPPSSLPLPTDGETILWNQSSATTNGVASQEFEAAQATYTIFAADDFTNAAPWKIGTIHVMGVVTTATGLNNASALQWAIYADNGGVPAGYPGGGDAPVWSISLPPTDAQVTLSDSNTDVTLNLTTPVNLPPGTYWLVFYPTMNFGTFGQWYWATSTTTNGAIAQMINPGNGFGYGTDWASIQVFTIYTDHDLAFRLDGQANAAAGIPTLGQWGMIFFVLLLAAVSLVILRRKTVVRGS